MMKKLLIGAATAVALASPACAQTVLGQFPANNFYCNPTGSGALAKPCTSADLATIFAANNPLASPFYLFNANTIINPTSPSSPAYQFKFGPPLFQVIADANRSAIVGQVIQNQASPGIQPAVIGYGALISGGAGNQVQGMFARAECQVAGGCTGIEIDAWNTSAADSPDTYPAGDSFGTGSVWSFGTKIAAAGTKINWAGISFVQEPTAPGNSKFRAGIYATPAIFQHYGGFFDADGTNAPLVSWLMRNNLNGVNLVLQSMGTFTKAAPVFQVQDANANNVLKINQDGSLVAVSSPSAAATDAIAWSITNNSGGSGAGASTSLTLVSTSSGGASGANFLATTIAGTMTFGASQNGTSAIRWTGAGSTFIDALNATGNFSIRTGGTPTVAMNISAGQVIQIPAVATGTPAASLCIDASNNIIKKTTAGSCI